MSDLPLLGSPVEAGSVKLRNRIAMVPMATGKATPEGDVTPELAEHYAARARHSSLGLVESEHHFVCADGQAKLGQPSVSRDEDVDGLARECAAVHEFDTPFIMQISHAGSAASRDAIGVQAIAPSAVTCPGAKVGHPVPREMSVADIERVTEAFAAAAARARRAGFDGVEVHAAHGYLLDEFLSPLTNRREDEYGGDLAGRMRIILEVIRAVRAEFGSDGVLSVRLGACDYMDGGTTADEGAACAVEAVRAGADLISVSGGMCYYSRRDTLEPGWFSDTSTVVRAALREEGLDAPVILAGGIRKLEDAERLLEQGACDIVGIGRPFLNNPDWGRRLIRRLGANARPSEGRP